MQPVMPNPAVAKHKVYDAACGLRTADDVVLLDRTRDLTEGGQILSAPGHAGRPRGLYRVYIGRPPRGSREHETGLYNEIHVTMTCSLLIIKKGNVLEYMLLHSIRFRIRKCQSSKKKFAIGHGWFSSEGGARPGGVGTTQYSQQTGMVKQKSQMQVQHWFSDDSISLNPFQLVTSSYYGPKAARIWMWWLVLVQDPLDNTNGWLSIWSLHINLNTDRALPFLLLFLFFFFAHTYIHVSDEGSGDKCAPSLFEIFAWDPGGEPPFFWYCRSTGGDQGQVLTSLTCRL